MSTYEAPAKLNLSLLVSPPGPDGYHPLESLVQTVEWCDHLEVALGEEGRDTIQSDIEDNLIERALTELRRSGDVPPLAITLEKQIPIGAGMGGGSADAAAALLAGADHGDVDRAELPSVAFRVGADVSLFLTGGTVMMRGVGYEIESVRRLDDFSMAVVIPEFGISTQEAYQRWDALNGPQGDAVPEDRLPPSLRGGMPMRNDLLPAALDLEPTLGDFMSDVASVWGTTVSLTGSGSACFGYFTTLGEAEDAAEAVSQLTADRRGVILRDRGVDRLS